MHQQYTVFPDSETVSTPRNSRSDMAALVDTMFYEYPEVLSTLCTLGPNRKGLSHFLPELTM